MWLATMRRRVPFDRSFIIDENLQWPRDRCPLLIIVCAMSTNSFNGMSGLDFFVPGRKNHPVRLLSNFPCLGADMEGVNRVAEQLCLIHLGNVDIGGLLSDGERDGL